MGYRITDTDGSLVTESNGSAKWTHAVVADYVIETWEQELAEAQEDGRAVAYREQALAHAKEARKTDVSTHKSYEAALKGIEKLKAADYYGDRFTNPRIVEVEQV